MPCAICSLKDVQKVSVTFKTANVPDFSFCKELKKQDQPGLIWIFTLLNSLSPQMERICHDFNPFTLTTTLLTFIPMRHPILHTLISRWISINYIVWDLKKLKPLNCNIKNSFGTDFFSNPNLWLILTLFLSRMPPHKLVSIRLMLVGFL